MTLDPFSATYTSSANRNIAVKAGC